MESSQGRRATRHGLGPPDAAPRWEQAREPGGRPTPLSPCTARGAAAAHEAKRRRLRGKTAPRGAWREADAAHRAFRPDGQGGLAWTCPCCDETLVEPRAPLDRRATEARRLTERRAAHLRKHGARACAFKRPEPPTAVLRRARGLQDSWQERWRARWERATALLWPAAHRVELQPLAGATGLRASARPLHRCTRCGLAMRRTEWFGQAACPVATPEERRAVPEASERLALWRSTAPGAASAPREQRRRLRRQDAAILHSMDADANEAGRARRPGLLRDLARRSEATATARWLEAHAGLLALHLPMVHDIEARAEGRRGMAYLHRCRICGQLMEAGRWLDRFCRGAQGEVPFPPGFDRREEKRRRRELYRRLASDARAWSAAARWRGDPLAGPQTRCF